MERTIDAIIARDSSRLEEIQEILQKSSVKKVNDEHYFVINDE